MCDKNVVDELLDPENSQKNAVELEKRNPLTEEQLAAVVNNNNELYSASEDENSASEDEQGLEEEESVASGEEGEVDRDGDDDSVGDGHEDFVGSPNENDVGNKEDDGVGDDDGSMSSVGEESAGPKEPESLVEFVKGKFPRSKVDGLKFLMDYQNKNKAALRGTVLEVPIKVDVWNEKYLLREMREIYNKVVPSVFIYNKKLIQAQTLSDIQRIPKAGRKLAKEKRTAVRGLNTKSNETTSPSEMPISSPISTNVTNKHHNSTAQVNSQPNMESVRVSNSTKVRTNVNTNVKSSKPQPETEDIPLSQIIQKKRSASNSKTKSNKRVKSSKQKSMRDHEVNQENNTYISKRKSKKSVTTSQQKLRNNVDDEHNSSSGIEDGKDNEVNNTSISKKKSKKSANTSQQQKSNLVEDQHNSSSGTEDNEETNTSGSDSELDINDYGIRNIEIENPHMLKVMKQCYRYFKDNKSSRRGGYAKFPSHLMSYLFHRSLSHLKGRYNPTNKCDINIVKYLSQRGGNPLHHFCCKLMKLTEEEYLAVAQTGNTLHFKRALKPKKIYNEIVPPCEAYVKLKKTLKITGW